MQAGLFLSTEMVAEEQRSEFWREISRPIFDLLPINEEKEDLKGCVHAYTLGELIISSVQFNQQNYLRDRRAIVHSGLDHYLLQVMTGGSLVADCDGLSVVARPGDIWLFDLARPYRCNAEAGSRITLAVPREPIDRANGGRSAHGMVLPGADPLTGMLRRYLVDLHETMDRIGPDDLAAMETATIELVSSITGRRPWSEGRQSSSVDRIRARMFEFIDAHIGDPQLGPELLMRHFQMSRAHLYRFFAELGGVNAVIRNRRLDAALRTLKRPSPSRRTITDLALELGFANSGHFTRAFTRRFSVSPSGVRPGVWLPDGDGGARRLQTHLASQIRTWNDRTALPTNAVDAEALIDVPDPAVMQAEHI
ncbi:MULTISPECIES: AraC-like ligand-binding domain-containing protein [Phenylobacterium]|uniref:AraC-like DNA-binding protein n=1 Tax=Phenylobacterium koreense TaxID=266125 RepID=A0ABV2EHM8_9CAUL